MELPALFKPEHSHSQALVLFESYLCYRTLLDVLSLRNSRWEHLVKLVYHLVKDVLDEECTEWLRLVQLSISVRDALLFPSQNTFSAVLKCIKINAELFSSDAMHKEFNDDLNRSIASYFVLEEKDKNKALEMCDVNCKLLEVVLAFPYVSPVQRMELRFSKAPSHVLGKILEHLRCKVMEMQSPALDGMFNNLEDFVQESEETEGVANHTSSEFTELSTDEMEASSESIVASSESMQWISSNPITTNTIATDDNSDIVGTETPSVCTDYRMKLRNAYARPGGVCKKHCLRNKSVDNVGPVGPSSYGKILPENKETKTSNSDDITDVTSSSCDEISEEDKNECFIPSDKSRHVKHRWTQHEVENLLDGVEKFGVGNWSNIYLTYHFLPCRNPVSLKDKWRNMLRNKEVPKKYL